MTEGRKNNYRKSGLRLVQHLDRMLDLNTGYPDEPSWGLAFTYLASLIAQRDGNLPLTNKALAHLRRQDKTSPNYSWEFVVYAIQTAHKATGIHVPSGLDCYRAKGTRMLNWFLLRTYNKVLCSRFGAVDKLKLWIASKLYQDKSGLILDEFKTRSLQYHAFCLFILAELIDSGVDYLWLKQWFIRGVDFSVKQILCDGTSLYLGRGQEQIFGYGALIYVLEYYHSKIQVLDEETLDRVSKKLLSFQRDDGSFPLVLRQRDPELRCVSFSQDHPAGWYGYNTLYDYQPFLAYCLLKASKFS
jgi:hypothetical protein